MYDFSERSTDQLTERKSWLLSELGEKRDAMSADDLEERKNEIQAIDAELEAREAAAQAAEEERQKVAASNEPVTKEFKQEERKMENRFAIDSPEYRDAFLRNLQGKEITAEERAAITATAAIPTQTMNQIVGKLELNPLIAAVDMTNIPGYVTYPAEDTINDAAWVPMANASTDSSDSLASITLGAYKLIKTVEVGADVEAMSVDAFETWIVERLANKIEKALDAGILNGTGTTQATGIKTTKSTQDGTFTRAGITWKQLTEIMGKLPGQYHPNASFVMDPTMFFGKVLGMVDSQNNRVVVNNPQDSRRFNVLGYPVIVDGNCGTEEIYFGDLKAYKFNFASDIEVTSSDEVDFRYGSRVWRAMTLADGKLADANAIVRFIRKT